MELREVNDMSNSNCPRLRNKVELWVANSQLHRFLAVLPAIFPVEIHELDRLGANMNGQ
jgi:hypothetical protein